MQQEHEIQRIKELLRHTGEFIAYFELVETKMIEWRGEIEEQAKSHQQHSQQELQTIRNELEALQEVLTHAGLARFRLSADNALQQGAEHLERLKHMSHDLLDKINHQQAILNDLTEKSLLKIDQHIENGIQRIEKALGQYDAKHFRLIAHESCDQVERVASNAVLQSTNLVNSFQWRVASVTLITSLITVLTFALYMNNELPWETHRHAVNERHAGKALLKAWPGLTEEEKNKILTTVERDEV